MSPAPNPSPIGGRSLERRASSLTLVLTIPLFFIGVATTVVSIPGTGMAAAVGFDCNGAGGTLEVNPSTVVVSAGQTITWSGSLSCTAGPCAGDSYQIIVPAGPFGGAWTSPVTALTPVPVSVTSPPVAAAAALGNYPYTINILQGGVVQCTVNAIIQIPAQAHGAPLMSPLSLAFLILGIATLGAVALIPRSRRDSAS